MICVVILDKDSHAIVVTPNYQSHETLPVAICEATGVALDPDDGWSLDIDRIAEAVGNRIPNWSRSIFPTTRPAPASCSIVIRH